MSKQELKIYYEFEVRGRVYNGNYNYEEFIQCCVNCLKGKFPFLPKELLIARAKETWRKEVNKLKGVDEVAPAIDYKHKNSDLFEHLNSKPIQSTSTTSRPKRNSLTFELINKKARTQQEQSSPEQSTSVVDDSSKLDISNFNYASQSSNTKSNINLSDQSTFSPIRKSLDILELSKASNDQDSLSLSIIKSISKSFFKQPDEPVKELTTMIETASESETQSTLNSQDSLIQNYQTISKSTPKTNNQKSTNKKISISSSLVELEVAEGLEIDQTESSNED